MRYSTNDYQGVREGFCEGVKEEVKMRLGVLWNTDMN